jgi:phosphoglycerate dehydrogenase-like enzyme
MSGTAGQQEIGAFRMTEGFPSGTSPDTSPGNSPGSATPTVVALGADLPARVADGLGGRARLRTATGTTLPELLPSADALLVWDFTSDEVARAWAGGGGAGGDGAVRGRAGGGAHPSRPRWVHTASAGVDRLMFPELRASETVVTNSRGVFEQPIAEYVAGLVLALAKDLPGTWRRQQERHWQHRETRRVAGTRALIVGAGPIGRAVARTLGALGIHTELVGRTARPSGDPLLGPIRAATELNGLLPTADWVICAAPLTDDTRHLFDAAAFAAMRQTAHFLNVGRGEHVLAADLLTALHTGQIAGAALDVFPTEPLPEDDPLWAAPGLLVSPHMCADTFGWLDELAEVFLAEFDRWLSGRPLRNVVDKQLGYVPSAVPSVVPSAAPHTAT